MGMLRSNMVCVWYKVSHVLCKEYESLSVMIVVRVYCAVSGTARHTSNPVGVGCVCLFYCGLSVVVSGKDHARSLSEPGS